MLTLSAMMRLRILRGFAPMAFLMPNSCVRSFTEMSIMLETPTMPLTRVRRPRIHMPMEMSLCPWLIWAFWE